MTTFIVHTWQLFFCLSLGSVDVFNYVHLVNMTSLPTLTCVKHDIQPLYYLVSTNTLQPFPLFLTYLITHYYYNPPIISSSLSSVSGTLVALWINAWNIWRNVSCFGISSSSVWYPSGSSGNVSPIRKLAPILRLTACITPSSSPPSSVGSSSSSSLINRNWLVL